MYTKLIQCIASEIGRIKYIDSLGTMAEHHARNKENAECRIEQLQKLLPSGAGFDAGTEIDVSRSNIDKIVMHTSFHHLNDNGYYDGWTKHAITVTPSILFDYTIKVSGRNRNNIKEYISEVFYYALEQTV